MESPLSPVVANLFMTTLEECALERFSPRPSTWFRFVDDVFSIVKKAAVHRFLRHLNDQHASIQFTMELEEDGKLPFPRRVSSALQQRSTPNYCVPQTDEHGEIS